MEYCEELISDITHYNYTGVVERKLTTKVTMSYIKKIKKK